MELTLTLKLDSGHTQTFTYGAEQLEDDGFFDLKTRAQRAEFLMDLVESHITDYMEIAENECFA